MNQTVLTSQGTITLPVEIRRRHGIKPGDIIFVEDNGTIALFPAKKMSPLREKNRYFLQNAPKKYVQGDGFDAHVFEKYGNS